MEGGGLAERNDTRPPSHRARVRGQRRYGLRAVGYRETLSGWGRPGRAPNQTPDNHRGCSYIRTDIWPSGILQKIINRDSNAVIRSEGFSSCRDAVRSSVAWSSNSFRVGNPPLIGGLIY